MTVGQHWGNVEIVLEVNTDWLWRIGGTAGNVLTYVLFMFVKLQLTCFTKGVYVQLLALAMCHQNDMSQGGVTGVVSLEWCKVLRECQFHQNGVSVKWCVKVSHIVCASMSLLCHE